MALSSNGRTVASINGNLFEIAAAQLGSAMQWINIARSNNLVDPMLAGQKQILIPISSPLYSDGIGPQ